MEKQIKVLIIIVVASVLAAILIPTSIIWLTTGGYGLTEEGQHFKVGTTIPVFHFQGLQSNTQHKFQMWHPTQDYSEDTSEWVYYFTSDSSGSHNWDIDLYLDHDGNYRCDLDWNCGGWCTVFGGGCVYSDGYRADIDITEFTVNPSTVEIGDIVTASWTVKNTGEFNGDFDWALNTPYSCDGYGSCVNSGKNIPLSIGAEMPITITFTVTENMESWQTPGNIFIKTDACFYGNDNQYPPEWYTTWGNNDEDTSCKSISYTTPLEPPEVGITYTMTVLTTPNNCNVNILGIGVISSGDNGMAMFEDVPYGTHDITVSKAGYLSSTKTIFINSDTATSMSLTSQNYLVPMLFLAAIILLGISIYYIRKK